MYNVPTREQCIIYYAYNVRNGLSDVRFVCVDLVLKTCSCKSTIRKCTQLVKK